MSADLPTGKTCRDCAHFDRCEMLFSADAGFPSSTSCDWNPSRFIEPVRFTRPKAKTQKEAILDAFDRLGAPTPTKSKEDPTP